MRWLCLPPGLKVEAGSIKEEIMGQNGPATPTYRFEYNEPLVAVVIMTSRKEEVRWWLGWMGPTNTGLCLCAMFISLKWRKCDGLSDSDWLTVIYWPEPWSLRMPKPNQPNHQRQPVEVEPSTEFLNQASTFTIGLCLINLMQSE